MTHSELMSAASASTGKISHIMIDNDGTLVVVYKSGRVRYPIELPATVAAFLENSTPIHDESGRVYYVAKGENTMKSVKYQYRIGHYVMDYDITNGADYGSKYGLSDLYEETEKNLKFLLSSTGDFRATWASKKELESACLLRINGELEICVNTWMDDLWESDDLIYDALWDVFGAEDEIPEDTIDEIKDLAFEIDCNDESSATWRGKCPDFESVMKIIDRLVDEANAANTRSYEQLKTIVKEIVKVERK